MGQWCNYGTVYDNFRPLVKQALCICLSLAAVRGEAFDFVELVSVFAHCLREKNHVLIQELIMSQFLVSIS